MVLLIFRQRGKIPYYFIKLFLFGQKYLCMLVLYIAMRIFQVFFHSKHSFCEEYPCLVRAFLYTVLMTINERVKLLRNTLKMSQAEFAKAIFISNGYMADLELGNRKVNDRIIHLISLTFGISETWLKDGTGNMFFTTSSEKLQRLTSLFNELPPKFQDYIMVQIEQLLVTIDK